MARTKGALGKHPRKYRRINPHVSEEMFRGIFREARKLGITPAELTRRLYQGFLDGSIEVKSPDDLKFTEG